MRKFSGVPCPSLRGDDGPSTTFHFYPLFPILYPSSLYVVLFPNSSFIPWCLCLKWDSEHLKEGLWVLRLLKSQFLCPVRLGLHSRNRAAPFPVFTKSSFSGQGLTGLLPEIRHAMGAWGFLMLPDRLSPDSCSPRWRPHRHCQRSPLYCLGPGQQQDLQQEPHPTPQPLQ